MTDMIFRRRDPDECPMCGEPVFKPHRWCDALEEQALYAKYRDALIKISNMATSEAARDVARTALGVDAEGYGP